MGDYPREALVEDLANDRKNFEKAIKHEDNSYLIAAFDDERKTCAGFLFFRKITEDTVELDLFLVLKEYRGKGVGKKLVNAVINYFSTTKQCYADTHRCYNDTAKKFYEKMGFVNQGSTPSQTILPGGVLASSVIDRWLYQIKK